MLPTKTFSWNTISKCFSIVSAWFAEMSHKERNIGFEILLGLAPQISHQPNVVIKERILYIGRAKNSEIISSRDAIRLTSTKNKFLLQI
jgi:hypothetical protein